MSDANVLLSLPFPTSLSLCRIDFEEINGARKRARERACAAFPVTLKFLIEFILSFRLASARPPLFLFPIQLNFAWDSSRPSSYIKYGFIRSYSDCVC